MKIKSDLAYMITIGYVVVNEKDTIDLMRFLDNLKWEQGKELQESHKCLSVITPLLIADYNRNADLLSRKLSINCPTWGD